MNPLFYYDRRKKTSISEQITEQVINFINDYKVIHGTPIKDLASTKKNLPLSDKEFNAILKNLEAKGYVVFDKELSTYRIQKPTQDSDFLIDVLPAYQQILAQGKTPSIENLLIEKLIVDNAFAKISGFNVGESLVHCKRLFYANDVPSILLDFYLSLEKMPLIDAFLAKGLPHLTYVSQTFPNAYQFHVREIQVIYAPESILQTMKLNAHEGQICTRGQYQFFNALGKVTEFGIAHMTDLTEFSTKDTDLTKLII